MRKFQSGRAAVAGKSTSSHGIVIPPARAQALSPAVSFLALSPLTHPLFEAPVLPIIVSAPGDAAYQSATLEHAQRAGVVVAPSQHPMLLQWDVSEQPPLDKCRPPAGQSSIIGLGFIDLPQAETVCAVFCELTAKPATDRVLIINDVDLSYRVNELKEMAKQPGENLQGLINFFEPVHQRLMRAQEAAYPSRRPPVLD